MKMIHVKPVPGQVIRNPANNFKPLTPEGETVPLTPYWLQRQADGGVIFEELGAKKPPAKPVVAKAPVRPAINTPAADKKEA